LMHNAPQPVFLVLDGRSIHRSRPVRDCVASQEGKLRVFFLPPHGPEIDPDEQVWNYVMRHGVGKAALRGASRSSLVRLDAPQLAPASAVDDPYSLPDARHSLRRPVMLSLCPCTSYRSSKSGRKWSFLLGA
jgi:hypothetical protein